MHLNLIEWTRVNNDFSGGNSLKKVILLFNDCEGTGKKVEIEGDFTVGRMKSPEGYKLTVLYENGETYTISSCPSTVSRMVISDDNTCASCHAIFFWKGDHLFLRDMGSSFGTLVNGSPLPGWDKRKPSDPVEIMPKSEVLLGGLMLIVEPVVEREKVPNIFKQLGLESIVENNTQSAPIIINIQNLDAGYHKNIGNIDVVANRSQVDIDKDEEETQKKKRIRNIDDLLES
jgi:pSer/pThr/pTyr-binding forkhead associated (FHA) protein